jgi:hypothetical protein
MDFRGQAIFSVWVGTVSLSALFLYYEVIGAVIMLLWLAGIGLTVWLAQLKPETDLTSEMMDLRAKLNSFENKLDKQNR